MSGFFLAVGWLMMIAHACLLGRRSLRKMIGIKKRALLAVNCANRIQMDRIELALSRGEFPVRAMR